MIADKLNIWDSRELAAIIADRYLDAEDLAEALPEAATVGSFEAERLDGFIEKNWLEILRKYEISDLERWIDDLEYQEDYEAVMRLWDDHDAVLSVYNEYLEEQYDEYVLWKWIPYVNLGVELGWRLKKDLS